MSGWTVEDLQIGLVPGWWIGNYSRDIGASDEMNASLMRLHSHHFARPDDLGPTLGEVGREYRIAHEQDGHAHRHARERAEVAEKRWRDDLPMQQEVADAATSISRLAEIARMTDRNSAMNVTVRRRLPVSVIGALRERHPDLADGYGGEVMPDEDYVYDDSMSIFAP
ncbi:hypothetical protein CZ771_13075 [Actinomycetales bacterium JB111]|nr:hypothetical protein CZ771_13075 [Actinomycetales bacterium JB111]